VYAPPADPEAIIRLCRDLDDSTLDAVAEGLLKGRHPNTYTFTKALAEWVVQEEAAGLPCAIVRPSIGQLPPINSFKQLTLRETKKKKLPFWAMPQLFSVGNQNKRVAKYLYNVYLQ